MSLIDSRFQRCARSAQSSPPRTFSNHFFRCDAPARLAWLMRRFVAQAGRRDAREYARGVKAAQLIMRQTKGKTGASSFLIVPVGGGEIVPSFLVEFFCLFFSCLSGVPNAP